MAVIGAGYWGPNLVRNISSSASCDLRWVCDFDVSRAQGAVGRYSTIQVTDDIDDILSDPHVRAVAIATPAHTHVEGRAGLSRGGQTRSGREASRCDGVGGREAGPGRRGSRTGVDVRSHLLLHARSSRDSAPRRRGCGRGYPLCRFCAHQSRIASVRHRCVLGSRSPRSGHSGHVLA